MTGLLAHGGEHHAEEASAWPRDWSNLVGDWAIEPFVVIPLLVVAWLFLRGLRRMWRNAGIGHGIQRWEAAAFGSGWLALVIALVSPLHPWGNALFAAHMVQHELLMLVAAPLVILGKPIVAFLTALPEGKAHELHQWWVRTGLASIAGFLARPFPAWLIHALVIWCWHIPVLFTAAMRHEWIHALQHATFLGSAMLFWWAVIHERNRAMTYGAAVLYLFTTAIHSGILGALITLATQSWYPAYAGRTESWGLSPVEDQQLGGLVMWVPACTIYIAAGLALFAAWLRSSELRVKQWERVPLCPASPSLC